MIDADRSVALPVPPGTEPVEVYAVLPDSLRAAPGKGLTLVVYAERDVTVNALATVPLSDELPPPAPEPWVPRSPTE